MDRDHEHHIEEEEEELLPSFKKYADLSDRMALGQTYLKLKLRLERLSKHEPSESELREQHIHM